MNYSLHDILGCNPKEDIIQDNLLINSNRKIKEYIFIIHKNYIKIILDFPSD